MVLRQNCDVTVKHNKEHNRILSYCDYGDQNMGNLIKKFHAAVSRGPMFKCTCYDQLWYKHSVASAQRSDFQTLMRENICYLKQALTTSSGYVRPVINILRKTKYLPVQLKMECHLQ